MNKLIAALLSLLLALPASAGLVVFNSVTPATGSCSPSALLWWRLEDNDATTDNTVTLDANLDYYGAGDNTAALTGATTDATSLKMGSVGLTYTSPGAAAGYAELSVTNRDLFNETQGKIGFWFRWNCDGVACTDTLPATDIRIFRIEGATSSNRLSFATHTTNSNNVALNYVGGGTSVQVRSADGLNTNPLTPNAWHYVELVWNNQAVLNQDTLIVWIDGVLTAGSATQELPAWTSAPTRIRIGNDSTTRWPTGSEVWYDQVIISSDSSVTLYTIDGTDTDCAATPSAP